MFLDRWDVQNWTLHKAANETDIIQCFELIPEQQLIDRKLGYFTVVEVFRDTSNQNEMKGIKVCGLLCPWVTMMISKNRHESLGKKRASLTYMQPIKIQTILCICCQYNHDLFV